MLSKLFSSNNEKVSVPWTRLTEVSQLDEANNKSFEKPVLLFKHSTRCSISGMSLSRFERSYSSEVAFEPYFIDLISYREVSNQVAERFNVRHESPQAILIMNGKAVFDASHTAISFEELNDKAQNS